MREITPITSEVQLAAIYLLKTAKKFSKSKWQNGAGIHSDLLCNVHQLALLPKRLI